jgi:transcriptional antiterminator RfaH
MVGAEAQWYVIKTLRFKENYVVVQLRDAMGVEAYAPIVKIPRKHARKGQPQFEPLFPGYVFARLDLTVHLLQVRRLHAANSLVCFDGRPASVPTPVIDDLRRKERGRGYMNLHVTPEFLAANSKVRIVEGPFSGHTGVFIRYVDSTHRVRILLDALQSGGALEVPLNALAAGR